MGLLSDLIGNAAITGNQMLTKSIATDQEDDLKRKEGERMARRQKNQTDYQLEADKKRQEFLDQLTAEREQKNFALKNSPERIESEANADNQKKGLLLSGEASRVQQAADIEASKYTAGKPTRDAQAAEGVGNEVSRQKALLPGKVQEARATHFDDGAGLRAKQIEAMDLTLSEKKEVNALIKEYSETQDPKRQAAVKHALIVRGIIKPGEFDTEKVTQETMNPDGTTTKTERTQRRNSGTESQGKVSQTESQAHNDAMRAISAGKISVEDANKRLASGGFKPLQDTREPEIPGRALYYANLNELKRIAAKPRGVSNAEANAAQNEITARQGEQRMKGN